MTWIKKKIIWILTALGIVGVALAAPPILATPSSIELPQMESAFMDSELTGDYIMQDATFIKPAKDENSIKIKLGKDGTDEFTPDFYISRWEDEVFFKMKPQGLDKVKKKDKILKTEGKKIKFETPDVDYHMYSLGESEEHPEGAYEYEVILKKRPKTNVITFDIETQGLDFFYQPELTQEEIDEGANRPENVVGSYAVYHQTKGGMNSSLGKEYKVGKAFHIYRPKIIDSNGWEVWGELNIDVEQKIKTVTLPQSFIDNAVYPIKQAIGAIFGYNGVGTTGATAENRCIAGQYQIGEDGTGDSLDFITSGNATAHNALGEIYDSTAANLIANGTTVELLTTSALTGTPNVAAFVSPPSFTSGSFYYLSYQIQSTGGSKSLYYDATGGTAKDKSITYPGAWTEPFGGVSRTRKYSVYVTYTPGGAEEAAAPAPPQEVIGDWFR